MYDKIVKLYNNVNYFYMDLRNNNFSDVDYISFIFQIITIIITIITFLTVMMSVEYQESVYKSREILFEINNLKNFEEINKKIKKLEYIEFEKKKYGKVLQLFKCTTFFVSIITIALAPIFFINFFIFSIILISIVIMIYVIFKINYMFYSGLNNQSLEYILDATYYEKNYSKDIIVFPNVIFNENKYFVLDIPIPIKNFIFAMQIELEDFRYISIMYKRNSRILEDTEPPNIQVKEINLEKIINKDISYYIKVDNTWVCFDVELKKENDTFIIIPKYRKNNETVSNSIIEMEKNTIENKIIVKKDL